MTVDSTKMELRLPAKKLKDIQAEARKLAQQREIPVRALSRLEEKMNAASHTIPPAPLFFRNLQMAMTEAVNASNQNYEVEITLCQDFRPSGQPTRTLVCSGGGAILLPLYRLPKIQV